MRLPARNLTLLVNALAHLTTSIGSSRSKTKSQEWVQTAVESLLQVPLGGFSAQDVCLGELEWLVFFAIKVFLSFFSMLLTVITTFFTPMETNMLGKEVNVDRLESFPTQDWKCCFFWKYVGQLCRKGKSPFIKLLVMSEQADSNTQPIFYAIWQMDFGRNSTFFEPGVDTEIYCYNKCKSPILSWRCACCTLSRNWWNIWFW